MDLGDKSEWYAGPRYTSAVDIPASPSEAALYDRLAGRLRDAMMRARLRPTQMTIVADEFFRAAMELVDLMPDDEPALPEPVIRTYPLKCRACQRDLGEVTLPEDLAGEADAVTCPGCIREGR
jgi:hypothetical protein